MGRTLRAVALLLAVLAAGCGKGESKVAQVQGKVYYRGVPLRGGCIVFTPDPERGGNGPVAYADVQLDGSYKLVASDEPGISPGWHRVTITGSAAEALPQKYSDPDQSGESHELKPGVVNIIDIRLD